MMRIKIPALLTILFLVSCSSEETVLADNGFVDAVQIQSIQLVFPEFPFAVATAVGHGWIEE